MKYRVSDGGVAAAALTLDAVTIARIQWLFERVCRHGYGAEPSLRVAVQVGAMRMVKAGATRAAIRSAFVECVKQEPSAASLGVAFATAEARVDSLRVRMAVWADDVAINSPRG